MSVSTSNAYGRITVTEEAIAQVAGSSALECYGIVDMISKRFTDSLSDMLKNRKFPVAYVYLLTETEFILIYMS